MKKLLLAKVMAWVIIAIFVGLICLAIYTNAKAIGIPPEPICPIPEYDYSDPDFMLHKWNTEKCCWDESWNGKYEEVELDESLGYDPNWTVAFEKSDGCIYYFHPNQGRGNAPAERETLPEALPKTGADL